MIFSSNLLYLREKEGMTQDQAARNFGIALSRYQHWERGRVLPQKPEFLVMISDLYCVSIDDLLRVKLVEGGNNN